MMLDPINRTLRMLAVMDRAELVRFYWSTADKRCESHSCQEREQLRLMLMVVDAIGELKWPAIWRETRQAA